MNLIDIFRTFHPNAEEYTFFSSAHGWNIPQDKPNLGSQIKPQLRKLKPYQASSLTAML